MSQRLSNNPAALFDLQNVIARNKMLFGDTRMEEGNEPPADGGDPPAGDDGNDPPAEDKKSDAPATVSQEEYDKLFARMQAADKAKAAAEAKAKEYEDKDKTELQRAQSEAEEAKKALEAAEEELKRSRINNAFLSSNKHEWHNADRALALLDLSGVEIDDSGNVVGIDKAIDALAKSDPYLIKSSPEGGSGAKDASGAPVGKAGDKKEKVDRDRLLEKYPALRR